MTVVQDENLGLAFLCVIAAGASTCVGAAIVFFPSLVKLASRKVLAAGLGFAAGVMIYVSFLDIFAKSLDSFVGAGIDEAYSYLYATLCFFSGVILMMFLEWFEKRYLEGAADELEISNFKEAKENTSNVSEESEEIRSQRKGLSSSRYFGPDGIIGVILEDGYASQTSSRSLVSLSDDDDEEAPTNTRVESSQLSVEFADESSLASVVSNHNNNTISKEKKQELDDLNKMGLKTAVTIALHNFPEGLATFVAYLADPRVGLSLAIASK